MTSKEAVLELICEAKSVNIDERRVCFLRKIIEKDLDLLEEYRKIEEELGIDLITLFKALKYGIYINEDDSVYKDCIKSIEHQSDGWGFISNDDYIEALFEDYGISWALDKEEFYKNIKQTAKNCLLFY